MITKWDRTCHRKLHRLMCYVNSTVKYRQQGYIGDPAESLELSLYSDADLAGCKKSAKSTSGVSLALAGGNTFFPLSASSKRQGCVSHSTPEAEIVAANAAVRTAGIPAVILWEYILNRDVRLTLQGDNTATIAIIKSGKSPTLRHISRTHRVNLRWLHDVLCSGAYGIEYVKTDLQAADIFTKPFTNHAKWLAVLALIGISDPKITSCAVAMPIGSDGGGNATSPIRFGNIDEVEETPSCTGNGDGSPRAGEDSGNGEGDVDYSGAEAVTLEIDDPEPPPHDGDVIGDDVAPATVTDGNVLVVASDGNKNDSNSAECVSLHSTPSRPPSTSSIPSACVDPEILRRRERLIHMGGSDGAAAGSRRRKMSARYASREQLVALVRLTADLCGTGLDELPPAVETFTSEELKSL